MYLNDLATILRAGGMNVIEVGGWTSRNHGALKSVSSIVCHHTAGAATGNYPSLNVVTYGRSDLAGPLCNLGLARDGTVYVVSNGVAWHAGATIQDSVYGNYNAIGIEAENTGSQPWPDVQVQAYAKLCALLCKHYSLPVSRVVGHKEICSPKGRKIDPAGLPGDMAGLRSLTQSYISGGGGATGGGNNEVEVDEDMQVVAPARTTADHIELCVKDKTKLYIMTAWSKKVDISAILFYGDTNADKNGNGVGGGYDGFGRNPAEVWNFAPNRPGPVAIPAEATMVTILYTANHDFTIAAV